MDAMGQMPPLQRTGFTLIELLVVIGLIALLAGMLFPVVRLIMESSRRAHATSLVSALHVSLRAYAAEDPSRRFPPTEGDATLRSSGDAAHPRVIDLLVPTYLNAGVERLVAEPAATTRQLMDPWNRPYRYRVDALADGAVQRPDAARADWNARGIEPFAYVWSLGRPLAGGPGIAPAADPDAAPGTGAPWIYVTTTAATTP